MCRACACTVHEHARGVQACLLAAVQKVRSRQGDANSLADAKY